MDLRKGLTVTNIRTGDKGKIVGFKEVWQSRHYVTKAEVMVVGEEKPKLWAKSSLKVVEAEAPRALVSLHEICEYVKENKDSIAKFQRENYDKPEYEDQGEGAQATLGLADHLLGGCTLKNQRSFIDINPTGFGRIMLLLSLMMDYYRQPCMQADDRLTSVTSPASIGNLMVELSHLYSYKK